MKRAFEHLAIAGGSPAFPEPLHVGRPNIGDPEKFFERTKDIFQRRWFTNAGHYVQEFERQLSQRLGVKHCLVMCNATVALEVAIRALDFKGEVIVPSFTFVATAHALEWQHVTPVFCDVDPATHNLDPAAVEALITPRTSGILGVHVWGRPCDTDRLAQIARKHGLRVLYDAAHAFACSHQGRMIGNFGDAEVFSFHATKFFNTFEGGAVATNDDALAEKVRLMRNFGFSGYDNVVCLGVNGKMNELSAAMGLTGLEALDRFIAANRQNYLTYQALLQRLPGLKLAAYNEAEKCNFQYIVAEVDPAAAGLDRDLLVKTLHAENVLARRYFHPGCHRVEPYCSREPESGTRLKHTEALTARTLSLPNGTTVTGEHIGKICNILECALRHAGRLKAGAATR